MRVGGTSLLELSLKPFLAHPEVSQVVVALHPDDVASPPEWLQALDPAVRVVAGGGTRLESVMAALDSLDRSMEVVLVHDAARPFVTRDIVDRCIDVARRGEGAVAGWPSVDTLKEVDDHGRVLSTPDRSTIWRAQTPQAFPRGAIVEAYRAAVSKELHATDDSALFSLAGGRVQMVEGSPWNLKVTHPDDVPVAEALLAHRPAEQ